MKKLSNAFSVLRVDVEDDEQEKNSGSLKKDEKNSIQSEKGKKKANMENGTALSKTDKQNLQNQSNSSEEYRMALVWIDLEMTGLDVERDRILEIACIITDGNLTKSLEGPDLVIHQSDECLNNMGEWCRNHHGESGLTKMVQQSKISEQEAEKQVIGFVKKHINMTQPPLLAGNSVYVDFMFLKKYMPDLASLFSHVVVDVSSVKALCIRWYPGDNKRAPSKVNKHRAMDDIKESIQELKYYKNNIFKVKSKK